MKMEAIIKYSRTIHIEGSNLQVGDSKCRFPYSDLIGKNLTIEEKIDGQNAAISFSESGELRLQSRGHYLSGGWRERHFAYLKSFASWFRWPLFQVLGGRYLLFGESMYCKHTIFYNHLPSYFIEYDVYDKERKVFLSTKARKELLAPLREFLVPVRVLFTGNNSMKYDQFVGLVGKSKYINTSRIQKDFHNACIKGESDFDLEYSRTCLDGMMEGLYVKVEEDGIVAGQYKWVRSSFTQTVLDSESHWQSRKIVPNKLNPPFEYV